MKTTMLRTLHRHTGRAYRFIAVLLAGLLALSLAACGSSSDNEETTTSALSKAKETTTEAVTEEQTTQEQTTQQAQDATSKTAKVYAMAGDMDEVSTLSAWEVARGGLTETSVAGLYTMTAEDGTSVYVSFDGETVSEISEEEAEVQTQRAEEQAARQAASASSGSSSNTASASTSGTASNETSSGGTGSNTQSTQSNASSQSSGSNTQATTQPQTEAATKAQTQTATQPETQTTTQPQTEAATQAETQTETSHTHNWNVVTTDIIISYGNDKYLASELTGNKLTRYMLQQSMYKGVAGTATAKVHAQLANAPTYAYTWKLGSYVCGCGDFVGTYSDCENHSFYECKRAAMTIVTYCNKGADGYPTGDIIGLLSYSEYGTDAVPDRNAAAVAKRAELEAQGYWVDIVDCGNGGVNFFTGCAYVYGWAECDCGEIADWETNDELCSKLNPFAGMTYVYME